MTEVACKSCKYITNEATVCKICGGRDFTKNWYGYLVVIDPEKSEIAKKLGIKYPGKYALTVS